MKKTFFIFFFLLVQTVVFAQLDKQYSKYIILRSQAIDYYPVWGKTDQHLYVNISSQEWRMYDLNKANFGEGSYLQYSLGINNAQNYVVVKDKKETKKLEKNEDWKPREVTDKANRKITLEVANFNTALFIEYEKGKKEKIMDIKGNAHSLAVSPSGKYLACLFEMSGLMVFDIEQEIEMIKKRLNEPIQRFKKSTQKIETKDIVGNWSSESADLLLDEQAESSFESEFREAREVQKIMFQEMRGTIKIEFLNDGTYQIEMTMGGVRKQKGNWSIQDGLVEIKEEKRFFMSPFSIDFIQGNLRIYMQPQKEKPFFAAILLLKR